MQYLNKDKLGRFVTQQLSHTVITAVILAALLFGAAQVGALDNVLAPAGAATGTSFTTVNYQGRLADAGGTPIDNPNPGIGMTFALYDVQTGDTALWSETHANVPISEGLFSVKLGSVNALSTDLLNGDRWLGIQVGNDPEMTPREKLAAVPYAMMASELDGSLSNKLHVSQDGRPPRTSGFLDYTLSLTEDTPNTDNKATIRFENRDESQGYIRLDGSYQSRKFVFGDDQGQKMDGEFTGDVLAKGRGVFGTPGEGEGGEIVLEAGSEGVRWYMDNYNNVLRWFNIGGEPSPHNVMRMQPEGNLWIKGSISHGASIENNLMSPEEQMAERISRFSEGDVLCWNSSAERLAQCTETASPLVIAVADVNGKPIVLGAEPVKVLGPVKPGDLLVASNTPGYAVAWSQTAEGDPPVGVVIAKALAPFKGERGLIKAMILGR